MIGLSTSLIQFASEQHSRLAFAAKLALLQRSVKINVPKKQQAKVVPGEAVGTAEIRIRVFFALNHRAEWRSEELAKTAKTSTPPPLEVRTRRAYFDCQFGQLHVRTAFPTTGGFDEQVTMICLHPVQASSRSFVRFLPEIADVRSVYAPDLPGCGESDPSPGASASEAAAAVSDLAHDLRLRQIDLLGLQSGAGVALHLAAGRPELVRRLVLVGVPTADPLPTVRQQALVLRTRIEGADGLHIAKAALPNGKFVDVADYAEDMFDAAPKTLAKQIGAFLSGR
jgi:pimeloyl-ACP methyl ester carboxylesterase